MLEIRQLYQGYHQGEEQRDVLRGIDLSVAAGESIALLGRSGSGKSTLLNMIAGIDQPTRGEVRIQGRDITRLSERDRTLLRRRHIGFVYQFFNLIPTLKVAENIALPLELNGVSEEEILSRVGHLLEEVGLGDRSDAFPDQLSGGEQQRVAIARALANQPALILADEPTGNLDLETGKQVLDLLFRICDDQQHTLVLVTHSLEVAKRADRLVTLVDGLLSDADRQLAW